MTDLHSQQYLSLSPYPLDMTSAFALAGEVLGADGIPYHKTSGPQPLTIVQYALAHWNAYLATHQEDHRQAFLIQARWLTDHAYLIHDRAAGWPIFIPPSSVISRGLDGSFLPFSHTSPRCLSAPIQACSLSVLLRAHLLTQESQFLHLAQLVFATFELDILDGGVSAPLAEQGIWFEKYALYPTSYTLSGMLFALLACYECSGVSSLQTQAASVFARAFSTLRSLLPEFDTGYWVCHALFRPLLLTPEQLMLHIQLLSILASLTGDTCLALFAKRWQHYLQFPQRLHYKRSLFYQTVRQKTLHLVRTTLFPRYPAIPTELRVCVPITAFPLAGGMRTILNKLAKSMQGNRLHWQMTYLTQRVGPQSEDYRIQRFGLHLFSPRQFPLVWGYVLSGWIALFGSLFTGASYDLILPQDGLFTAAFAAPLARLAGIRVVCVDHGNLAALPSQLYRKERLQSLESKSWFRRYFEPWLFSAYWPSLQVLARISARFVDCYAIPGVPGDGIEQICQHLGIPTSRLVRFVNTIDVEQYCLQDQADRAVLRLQRGLPADAIVVSTICRLSPEKGVEIALQAIYQALSQLPPALRTRVRFIIAGDGILRSRLEEQIIQLDLALNCMFWGEISPAEALLLHTLSDIYIYSGTRGGGYSLVMLEAMAAASAVLASDVPLANAQMLADERGLLVSAGNVAQTAQALVRLLEDEDLRLKLGRRARKYVSQYNTEQVFLRFWQRVTCWSDLNEYIGDQFPAWERKGRV